MSLTPSDDVLRELGRIVWEAITAEDHVYQVAGHLTLDPEVDPVGTCIRRTINRLSHLDPHPDLVAAIAWLEEAKAALEDRNAVLHGIPTMSFARTSTGAVAPVGPTAIDYPGGRGGTVGRFIPLDADGLHQIASRLANINARWQAVTIGVSQFRDVPWGSKPGPGLVVKSEAGKVNPCEQPRQGHANASTQARLSSS